MANERKSQRNNLVVSAGDVFGNSTSEVEKQKAEFALAAMQKMGYDAVALGDFDFVHGVEFLQAQLSRYPFFVCANVVWADTGKPLANPVLYRTYRLDAAPNRPARAVTVAVFGVMSDLLTDTIDSLTKESPRRVQVLEPFEAARKVVAEARKRAQLVVALAHMDEPQAKEMALHVPGIDVIVLGHAYYRKITQPQKVNSTLLVAESNAGKHMGQLILALNSMGGVEASAGCSVVLDDKVADDPEVARMLSEAKAKWEARQQPVKPPAVQPASPAAAGK